MLRYEISLPSIILRACKLARRDQFEIKIKRNEKYSNDYTVVRGKLRGKELFTTGQSGILAPESSLPSPLFILEGFRIFYYSLSRRIFVRKFSFTEVCINGQVVFSTVVNSSLDYFFFLFEKERYIYNKTTRENRKVDNPSG